MFADHVVAHGSDADLSAKELLKGLAFFGLMGTVQSAQVLKLVTLPLLIALTFWACLASRFRSIELNRRVMLMGTLIIAILGFVLVDNSSEAIVGPEVTGLRRFWRTHPVLVSMFLGLLLPRLLVRRLRTGALLYAD